MRTPRLLIAVILIAAMAPLVSASPACALNVGDKAPEFSLVGPGNKPVKLSELTAKGPVVLYTFIAAFTPT
jgi:hypothetical protein